MSGVLARWWSRQAAASEVTATGVALVVTLLLSAALYPDYLDREAFTSARRRAIEWQSSDDRRAREWIRGEHASRRRCSRPMTMTRCGSWERRAAR